MRSVKIGLWITTILTPILKIEMIANKFVEMEACVR